jgi:hypothetical protein
MGTPEAQEIEGRASEFETLSGDELLKLEARLPPHINVVPLLPKGLFR